MKTPVLDDFMKGWIGLFTRSPKTKLAWKTATGLQVPTYSATRWWSKWEVMNHLLKSFGDVCSFLQNDELPPSKLKLLEILHDSPKNRKLQMKLAMTIDAGEPFVKAAYRDGPHIFSAYEEINALTASISTQFYTNTIGVARKLSSNPVQQQQLIDYSKSCVQPAYSYFNVKFGHDLKQTVEAFKYARFFDPTKMTELKPFCNDIDQLKVFPFFNSDDKLDELKAELPTYLAKADGVSPEMDKLDWWRKHENELPTTVVKGLQNSFACAALVSSS